MNLFTKKASPREPPETTQNEPAGGRATPCAVLICYCRSQNNFKDFSASKRTSVGLVYKGNLARGTLKSTPNELFGAKLRPVGFSTAFLGHRAATLEGTFWITWGTSRLPNGQVLNMFDEETSPKEPLNASQMDNLGAKIRHVASSIALQGTEQWRLRHPLDNFGHFSA